MTESEAIKIINGIEEVRGELPEDGEDVEIALMMAKDALSEAERYRAIGTVEELRELKEKAEPKKPEYWGDGYADGELVYDYAKCPICGHDFEYGINDWECEYCSDCGQRLDWQ